MPNKNDQIREKTFLCTCGCRQFVQVSYDAEDKKYGGPWLWFSVIGYTTSLWQCLKWWWHHRKTWACDIELTLEDACELHDAIENFIDAAENQPD